MKTMTTMTTPKHGLALWGLMTAFVIPSQAHRKAGDPSSASKNIPLPDPGDQATPANGSSEPEMAHFEVERGAFAIGIFGALAFSGLVWTAIYWVAKLL